MRLRIDDAAARLSLATTLMEAGCSALPIGETLEIPAEDAGDAATELELRFFLRAWQQRHPHVQLLVVA